jgi:glycosyltransferase involved in cell wall biosynthesis
VATFHDLRVPYLFPKAGPLRAAVRDRLLRGVDAAIFTDPADWRAAAAPRPVGRYWVPIGSNIAVAPPPGYERAAWRRAAGADPDTLLVAHLGLLNHSKGVTTLLRGVAALRRAGRPVRLLLIGAESGASDPTNEAYARAVEREIAALDLQAVVQRLPLLAPPEVSASLLACDAAAFPFTDGASLRRGSLLAGLAHGLPTVSTWPPTAAPERRKTWPPAPAGDAAIPVLRDGANLVLVPAEDPAALAAALGRLADDAALRARLADGARALVATLAWPRIAAAHRAIYAALGAGRGG